jgi:hypothetical protein
MKTAFIAGLSSVAIAFVTCAQTDTSPDQSGGIVPISNTISNSPPQPTAPLPTPPLDLGLTPPLDLETGPLPVVFPPVIPIPHQIRPVPGGAIGDWGMIVVNFPNDLSAGPVSILAPDPGQDNERARNIMTCCEQTANNGPYILFANDCHNHLDRCLSGGGNYYPIRHPRFGRPTVSPVFSPVISSTQSTPR